MQLVVDVEAWQLPFVAIGAGFLALAAWLLVLDFPSRLNRAFALYLFLDGMPQFARVFAWTTPDGFAVLMVSVVMRIAAPFALVYFMLAYEERFGSRSWRRPALVPLLVVPVLLAGATLHDPAWYSGSDGAADGPLRQLTSWLHVLTPCVAALLFARGATAQASDSRRRALLLASLAFAAGPLFSALHLLVPGSMGASAVEQLVRSIALLPIGLLAIHMVRVARGHRNEAVRDEARRFLAFLALPVASVLVFALAGLFSIFAALWLMSVMMSAWMLALPLLVTYALVRHRLFDVDVKIRWGISRGSIAGAFIAVFFVASEAAQQFLGETLGSAYFGIAAAGALVFAMAPLQRAAERLAERAVPVAGAAAATASAGAARREDAYRRAVRFALRDRDPTRDEERDLVLIASELGLAPARAFALRDDVERETRGDPTAARVAEAAEVR